MHHEAADTPRATPATTSPATAPAPVADAAGADVARWDRRLAMAVRRPFAKRPWTFEVALFALALLVYQGSRALVIGEPSTAFENAAGIIDWEKSQGLFVETSIQEWILNHIQLAEFLNYFYMYAHWTVTPLFFIVLYKKRARVYPYVRNAFLAANGIALIVFMLYPVAPPRLAGAREGFVDTLHNISDIDLQGGVFSGWFNPHAAVPSMHFGYALLIGIVGTVLLRSLPLRLLALAYPVAVFLTITGTANHYVIDALAGGLVVAIGFVATWAWMSVRGTLPVAAPVATRRG
ncbi:phosphatase PAP2 family protein [Miltoncostaea marina]|uniref:phosphatase PAP2 family protein n=1 Tax=Miltoncostaea marina TaxID=2843215 RepID=UPI001C3DE6FA|nr:phosphatase PAP2 family protein [Miltoncostaea marina]